NRGGKGYFVCKLTEETGHVIAVEVVNGDEDIMLITIHGVLIRIPVEGISITGRSTQGVRLIRLQGDEEVATVTKIIEEEPEEEEETEDIPHSSEEEQDSDVVDSSEETKDEENNEDE